MRATGGINEARGQGCTGEGMVVSAGSESRAAGVGSSKAAILEVAGGKAVEVGDCRNFIGRAAVTCMTAGTIMANSERQTSGNAAGGSGDSDGTARARGIGDGRAIGNAARGRATGGGGVDVRGVGRGLGIEVGKAASIAASSSLGGQ